MEESRPLILVDGYCNLCNGTVRFVQKRDKNNHFQFTALQSEFGKSMIKRYQIPSEIDSVVLILENQAFLKSDVIIESSNFLPNPWKIIKFFAIIPKSLRDKLYDFIARNRYKWFGKKQVCEFYPPVE